MVYDRAFQRQGALGAWQKLDLTLVRNGVSVCSVTAPAGHPKMVDLRESGARFVVLDDETGDQVFSGGVRAFSGSGPGDEQITVTAQSDHRMLNTTLAWPSATAALDAQPAYRRVTNTTLEATLKILVIENAARLGMPITVAPSLARGPVATTDLRFEPILEKLQERLDASDLTVTMVQDGDGLVMDVRESRTIRRVLSVGSGALVSYQWDVAASEGSRAVVAGQGEGAARELRQVVISGREDARGFPEEIFVDARDVEDASQLPGRGTAALEETRQKSGLSLTLTETPAFRYGVHYELGDTVTVQTAAGPITDRIRQIKITVDRDNGLTVTPQVGERSDDPDTKLIRFVKKFAGATSRLERR